MTPWEWIGVVMARSDTQRRTSADGRFAVIRCGGPRAPGENRLMSCELVSGAVTFQPTAAPARSGRRGRHDPGRLCAPAIKAGNSDDSHSRASMRFGEIPDEPAGSRRGRNPILIISQRRIRRHVK